MHLPGAQISKSTFYRWMERGDKQKTGIYRDFRDAVQVQETASEVLLLERIQNSKDWRAAAWILERRYPDRWGRRRIELSGPDGDDVPLGFQKPPEDPPRVYIIPTPEQKETA